MGAACAAVLGVVVALVAVSEYTFGYFSRDPASTLGGSPVVGLLTYVGVLVAWGAAVGTAVTAWLTARAPGGRPIGVLLVAALGLGYLALDDLFQVHEELVPEHLRIPQELVLCVYAAATGAFAWRFRAVLREHEWPLLGLALGALGASVLLDQSGDYVLSDVSRYLEESLKLFGLALLGTYLLRLGATLHAEAYGGRGALPVQVPDHP